MKEPNLTQIQVEEEQESTNLVLIKKIKEWFPSFFKEASNGVC